MISRTTSSMARRLLHDSAAESSAASMTLRWIPLEKKSLPPMSTMTLVSRRERANRYASCRRRHCSVLIAPL